MEIRYRLDPELDAKMIADILARAGGGSPSQAAYLLAVERAAVVSAANPTESRQHVVSGSSDLWQNEVDPEADLFTSLEAIDEEFSRRHNNNSDAE